MTEKGKRTDSRKRDMKNVITTALWNILARFVVIKFITNKQSRMSTGVGIYGKKLLLFLPQVTVVQLITLVQLFPRCNC